MPRGDGTGPVGIGSMSGRAAGFCVGNNMPGYLNNTAGRGFGMGFGRGANFGNRGGRSNGCGWRNRFGVPGRARFGNFAVPFQQADPETEKQVLKSQSEYLQSEMEAIKKRLDELTIKEPDK